MPNLFLATTPNIKHLIFWAHEQSEHDGGDGNDERDKLDGVQGIYIHFIYIVIYLYHFMCHEFLIESWQPHQTFHVEHFIFI